jgi:hypothetical protein
MSNTYNQTPTIRSILLGIALFLIGVVLLCSLAEVIKLLSAPLLFFPAKLGLIQDVTADDVITVKLATTPSRFNLYRPGAYVIYQSDVDILELTDALGKSHATPWVKIKTLNTGESIPVTYVERGLLPFDSALVRGRPIFTFNITTPGTYEMSHLTRPTSSLSILPDAITGHETLIVVAAIVQLAILFSPVIYIGLRRYRQYQAELAVSQQRTAQVNEKWREIYTRWQAKHSDKEQ